MRHELLNLMQADVLKWIIKTNNDSPVLVLDLLKQADVWLQWSSSGCWTMSWIHSDPSVGITDIKSPAAHQWTGFIHCSWTEPLMMEFCWFSWFLLWAHRADTTAPPGGVSVSSQLITSFCSLRSSTVRGGRLNPQLQVVGHWRSLEQGITPKTGPLEAEDRDDSLHFPSL